MVGGWGGGGVRVATIKEKITWQGIGPEEGGGGVRVATIKEKITWQGIGPGEGGWGVGGKGKSSND